MKKSSILLLFITLTTTYSYSQDTTSSRSQANYVGISFGLSMPIGDFGDNNLDDESGGFAQPGFLMDINYSRKLAKHWGLTAMLRFQSNSMDAETFSDELNKYNPGDTFTASAGAWSTSGYLVGAYGDFTSKQPNLSFNLKAMFGLANATSPNLHLEEGGLIIDRMEANARAFSYLIGAGIKRELSEKCALLINIDYFASEPEFTEVKVDTNLGPAEDWNFKQSYATINTSISIVYKF